MKYARAPSALRSNDFAFLSPLTNIQPFPLLILSFSLIEYSKLLVLHAPPSLALALALASIDPSGIHSNKRLTFLRDDNDGDPRC
ncbi:hypothetical protein KQX54_008212 [Cotesia glomerata]|uniref:Uncharacterized protein n=1 Tax=Cotesia glomerata TaxID=32391 RepID=A0AAV7HI22_COTGL|nr:hypothetical protein KQX54_008212 [Cotesia glomerata]